MPSSAESSAEQNPPHSRSAMYHQDNEGFRYSFPWAAFRAYYNPIFSEYQQEQASTYLTKLWQQDTYQNEWCLVAAAYSRIQISVSNELEPLNRFLQLVCPALGIVSAEDYLQEFRWSKETDAAGVMTLSQAKLDAPVTVPSRSFRIGIVEHNMSEDDIISYAIAGGYMPNIVANTESLERNNQSFTPNLLEMNSNEVFQIHYPKEFMHPDEIRAVRVMFRAAVAKDPRAVIALLLGLDVDHPFISASADESLPAVDDSVHRDQVSHDPEVRLAPRESPIESASELPSHLENASVQQLYDLAKLYHDQALERMYESRLTVARASPNPDISDPATFENEAGYDAELEDTDLPVDPNMAYTFHDSF